MGEFKRGFNKPDFEGIYVSKNDMFVWEFKVFHKHTGVPTYFMAKEFRTNETIGPSILPDGEIDPELEKILEAKSNILYEIVTSK